MAEKELKLQEAVKPFVKWWEELEAMDEVYKHVPDDQPITGLFDRAPITAGDFRRLRGS